MKKQEHSPDGRSRVYMAALASSHTHHPRFRIISDILLTMSDIDSKYDSSLRSNEPGYKHSQTFMRDDTRTGPRDPEQRRADIHRNRRDLETPYIRSSNRDTGPPVGRAPSPRSFRPSVPSTRTARRAPALHSETTRSRRGPSTVPLPQGARVLSPVDAASSMSRSSTSTYQPRRASGSELERRMGKLSISEESYNHLTNVSGGFYSEDSSQQHSYQEYPAPSRPSHDVRCEDPRENLRNCLRPLGNAALPYVKREDYVRAKADTVIAREVFIENMSRHKSISDNTSAHPQNFISASPQRPGYAESILDTSSQGGSRRRHHDPASQGGYIHVSGQSDGFQAQSVRSSLPSERFEPVRYSTARRRQETIMRVAYPVESEASAPFAQPEPTGYSSSQRSVGRGYQDPRPPG